MTKPVIIQLDEKLKGSKLVGSPSRLAWEEDGRTFALQYKRRDFSLWKNTGRRERSGAYAHGMLGINNAEDFFVKILDNRAYSEKYSGKKYESLSSEEKQKIIEADICEEAESLNLYYGKDCCRVLRRSKIAGDAYYTETKRYYLIIPKEKGVAVSVKLENDSPGQANWEAAVTQAMHPLYHMAILKRDKGMTFIHKDIKPLNLIWPDVPNAPFKLIDFGIACHSRTSEVIKIDTDDTVWTTGYQSPQSIEESNKVYYHNRISNDKKQIEYTYHDDHYAMAATLALIFFKKIDKLPWLIYEPKKNELQTGFGAAINDARKLIYYIGQLNDDDEFTTFLKRNDSFLTQEQVNFITWVRPFTNGTSENTPEYIENKLREYRALFKLKEGEGISTYRDITFDNHADINQLSTQGAQESVEANEENPCQVIARVFGLVVDNNLPLKTLVDSIHDAVSIEITRLDSGSSKYWHQLERTDIKKSMQIRNARNSFESDPTQANAKQLRNALNVKRNPSDSAESSALTNVKNALKAGDNGLKQKMS